MMSVLVLDGVLDLNFLFFNFLMVVLVIDFILFIVIIFVVNIGSKVSEKYMFKKKIKIKNFMIEFLNVVIDVYVIFFYFKYYMFFKKWILDCSFYFLGVLGRFV